MRSLCAVDPTLVIKLNTGAKVGCQPLGTAPCIGKGTGSDDAGQMSWNLPLQGVMYILPFTFVLGLAGPSQDLAAP